MRNRDNMRTLAEDIVTVQREEATYRLGRTMRRKRSRGLMALRMLSTEAWGGRIVS